jgi:hypothetical protein
MTQTRLSSDGRFRWHEDLGVWEPIAHIPAGVTTPDGRYRWDGARWQVNLVAAEGWSRVAQDEAEERDRPALLCPRCKRGTIRMYRCDNCGLVRWDAEYIIEHGTLPRAPVRYRHPFMAGIAAVFLVLMGIVIVGFALLVLAFATGSVGPEAGK